LGRTGQLPGLWKHSDRCVRHRTESVGHAVSLWFDLLIGQPAHSRGWHWQLKTLMPAPHNPTQNHLLAALPFAEFGRLSAHLELVPLSLGDILCESDRLLEHVYFPTTSIISMLYVMTDGASTEIAMVGNEGMLGVSLFLGGGTTPGRALVQSAGYGYRLPATLMLEEFNRAAPLRRLLLRYTQALITQVTQTAVCNRHHSIEQQLCRMLLLSLDRLPTDTLTLTQELIAAMLGVRRVGITAAAGNLQRAGLIRYHRGSINVLDRPGLERASCECYAAVKREFDRLMMDIPAQELVPETSVYGPQAQEQHAIAG